MIFVITLYLRMSSHIESWNCESWETYVLVRSLFNKAVSKKRFNHFFFYIQQLGSHIRQLKCRSGSACCRQSKSSPLPSCWWLFPDSMSMNASNCCCPQSTCTQKSKSVISYFSIYIKHIQYIWAGYFNTLCNKSHMDEEVPQDPAQAVISTVSTDVQSFVCK